MDAEEIITKFELQVSDLTELATQEELDLLNEIYVTDICSDRPWEFLKTEKTGSLSLDGTTGLYYATLPDDFSYICENDQYTDNTIGIDNNASPKVIFIGTAFQPYQLVNYSDRVKYRNVSAVCWVDLNANRIYFPVAPSDTSYYKYDYIKVPDDLALGDTPIFPARFHKMIAYAMAMDNDILQLSAKAQSYLPENKSKFQQKFDAMALWNANLLNN